jgi:hypothetical protein
MEIKINKNLVGFKADSKEEEIELVKLWRLLVSCTAKSKNLAPVGEYIPGKEDCAQFYIEGLSDQELGALEEAQATEAYCCMVCNKYLFIEPGEAAPICCGAAMKPVD